MKADKHIHKEIINRLVKDFQFEEQNGYLRKGVCPACHKKELFTSLANPWVIKCGRENKCGREILTKEHYSDLFNNWSERYIQSPASPHAAADAYLEHARGLETARIGGAYSQESYHSGGMGSATIRFSLPGGAWWERIIDKPERFDRKANFKGTYAGQWWICPSLSLEQQPEIWIAEGIFDALSLIQNGIAAVSIMTAGNYPEQALKELAGLYKGKALPKLVWALDNGQAGEKAILRHVKRSRDEGWKAGAALPSESGSGVDWNDLHLRGKLTPRHLKTYRYNGALLLAGDAREKALLMFEHSERQEFHFEHGSRLYWFKLDIERHMKAVDRILGGDRTTDEREARRIALEESGAIKEIANCYPVPLYFQRSEPTDEAWYYLRVTFPGSTPAVKGTFTAAQLSSASEFKKRLLHIAKGAIYTGNTPQLDRLIRHDLPRIKEVQTQNYIGYNRDWRAWVFNSLAVSNGVIHTLNSEDYFGVEGKSIKSLSHSPELQLNADETDWNASWVNDLWTAFGTKGFTALAFWLGSFFAEQIRESHKSYPFLEIVGEPGTGKSTLLDFLWRLCGRDDYEGFDPSKSTPAARARNFAQVSNLPVVLIEGDRTKDTQKQRGFDFDDLKPLYNGRGVRATGIKTNNNETYEPPFRGAIVIAQNAVVDASPAMLERIVHLYTDKRSQSTSTRDAAERLERMPVENVSGFLLRAVQKENDILSTVEKVYSEVKPQLENHPKIRHNRIAKNHAQMIAFTEALACVLPVSVEQIRLTRDAVIELAVERVQATERDVPEVCEFWDMFDDLNSLEKFGVNHYGKDNQELIAVNFAYLAQVASLQRVPLPASMRDIQRQLRTGKARRFEGIKAVRSQISEEFNAGKGKAGVTLPEVFKCWVFRCEP
ncbi:toprim domain-containing protein [Salmonella enterica subsp. enterica serovar Stanleyville]|nr:toprim domain-containing protein [Salmonella enterica subsp. enterica serovar Stanleyville]EAM3050730.1 bifunctional DNA primase/helicase [Salmonella enterica]AZT63443.1 toprim domain-containing protein [Salmonella enterica subsp. enterica serovar Stanleyville]EAA7189117.1 bifunctional DNA primase/helicase [Salmonella enterica subsp. enterica serovar Stanleyville]EAP0104749.1 bifunctional DNA primase/helicase [Salmonella enterica]